MSIPVLICPCISRFDLFERMIKSIDHPVDRIVLIENSCTGYTPRSLRFDIEVIRPITNIGYGGGINAGIAQTPDAPWWVFVNADVAFQPDALAKLNLAMDVKDGPRFVHDTDVNSFAFAGISREVVEEVGLFDEWTFFPAYYEDNDYAYRMKLAGIERTPLPLGAIHGDHGHEGHEHGSLTIRSEERFMTANKRSFVENRERYVQKWGGMPDAETYTTPWGRDLPLSHVFVDLVGRTRRAW